MKVLHVIRGLANSSGTTHIVVPLSEEQARQGCEVTVFYVEKDKERAVEPDPEWVKIYGFPLSVPFSNPGISADFAKAIRRRIREFDIVHIHAVWNFPTYYAMRVARQAGTPYVVAPQGSFEPWALRQNYWGKKFYGMFTEVPLLKRAAFMQALTEKEAGQFRQFGIETPAAIIPNGVEERFFERRAPSLAESLGLPSKTQTLLFLSRLHPKKGLDVLLPAFADFAPAFPAVTLVIAGHDGGSGYAAVVRQLAEDLGIVNRCVFFGEVRGERKYDMLLGADAFVLPSHSEGLPVAAVEAMGAGLPVVISQDCNIPEVAEYDAGFVVSANRLEISAALKTLFADGDRSRRMGINGRRLVSEKFSWRKIAEETRRVYESACGPAN